MSIVFENFSRAFAGLADFNESKCTLHLNQIFGHLPVELTRQDQTLNWLKFLVCSFVWYFVCWLNWWIKFKLASGLLKADGDTHALQMADQVAKTSSKKVDWILQYWQEHGTGATCIITTWIYGSDGNSCPELDKMLETSIKLIYLLKLFEDL